MASPIPPPTPGVRISATQVKVMRIKDNVARLQFGGHFWDVSILELGIDAAGGDTSKKLNLTDVLADKVQSHFQKLADEGVFDPHKSKKVVLEGRRIETPAPGGKHTVDVAIDKIEAEEEAAAGLKPVDLAKISTVAQATLKEFGQSLVESDVELHEDLSAAGAGAGATGTGAAVGKTSPPTVTPPPPATAERTVTKDVLSEEFSTRDVLGGTTPNTDPITHLETLGRLENLRGEMAKFITDFGSIRRSSNKFDEGDRFAMIGRELKRLATEDMPNLETAAKTFTGSIGSYGKFADREVAALATRDFSTIAAPAEKKKLVALYAEYLKKAGNSKMGEDFYQIYSIFSRDTTGALKSYRQIQIVEQDSAGKLKLGTRYPKAEPLSPTNCIYVLKKTPTPPATKVEFHVYDRGDRAASPGVTALRNLGTLTEADLAPTSTKQVEHLQAHSDGAHVDTSIAHQILTSTAAGAPAPSEADIKGLAQTIRTAAAARIAMDDFTANNPKTERLQRSLLSAIQKNQAHLNQEEERLIQPILKAIASGSSAADITTLLNALPGGTDLTGLKERLKFQIYLAQQARTGGADPGLDYGQIQIDTDPTSKDVQTALAKIREESVNIQALCTKDVTTLTLEDKMQLRRYYSALVRAYQEAQGEAFMAALSEIPLPTSVSATTTAPFHIMTLQDNMGADKATRKYSVASLDGLPVPVPVSGGVVAPDTLYLWTDGKGHFHSANREGEALREALA